MDILLPTNPVTETAVSNTEPVYSTEQLAGITSFEDALALLADAGVNVTSIADYGDGFSVMDKATLVNVPFVILDYKFAEGEFGSDFAIVRVVTADKRKAIITDGSLENGIRPQVKELQRRGALGGVICDKGLTVSEYTWIGEENGKEVRKPAKTYYLSGM